MAKILCPNFKDKSTKEKFRFLQEALGDARAYSVWNENNGFPDEGIPFSKFKGEKSELFEQMQKAHGTNIAIQVASWVNSEKYINHRGDWKNNPSEYQGSFLESGEPDVANEINETLGYSLSSEEKRILAEEADYNIEGLDTEEVLDVLNFMNRSLISGLDEGGNLIRSEFYGNLENGLKKHVERMKKLKESDEYKNDEKAINTIDSIIDKVETVLEEDNFAKIIMLFEEEAESNNIKIVDEKNSKVAPSDPTVKETWNDAAKLSISSKDTSKARAKSLLSSVPIPVRNKDGVELEGSFKKTFFQTSKFHDIDFIISLLNKELEGVETEEDMMNILENSLFFEMRFLHNKLNDPNSKNINQMRSLIKNSFTMNSNGMKSLKHNENKGDYYFNLINTNRNDVTVSEFKNWITNQQANVSKFSGKGGIFTTSVIKKNGKEEKVTKYNQETFRKYKEDIKASISKLAKFTKKQKDLIKFGKEKSESAKIEEYEQVKEEAYGEIANQYSDLLMKLGVNLGKEDILYFIKNDYKFVDSILDDSERAEDPGEDSYHVYNISNSKTKILGKLLSNIPTENLESNFSEFNILNNKSVKKVLGTLSFYINRDVPALNFRNESFDLVSEYTLPTHNQTTLKELKDKGEMYKLLKNSSFYSNSYLLKALEENPNSVDFSVFSSASKSGSGKTVLGLSGKKGVHKRSKMSRKDRLIFALNLFADQGRKTFWSSPVVFADKSKDNIIKLPKLNFTTSINSDTKGDIKVTTSEGQISKMIVDNGALKPLEDAIYSEALRINEVLEEKENYKDSNYYRYGNKFYLLNELNDEYNGEKIPLETQSDRNKFRTKVREILTENFKEEVNDLIKFVKDNDIDLSMVDTRYLKNVRNNRMKLSDSLRNKNPKNKEVRQRQNLHTLLDFVVHNRLASFAYVQSLGGDPAEYSKKGGDLEKAWDSYFKRMGGASGTSMRGNFTFRHFLRKGGKLSSRRIDNYDKIALLNIQDPKTSRYAEEYFNHNYKGIEMADAQEFITVREYAINKYAEGSLSDDMFQSILKKIEDAYKSGYDYTLTDQQIRALGNFIPQKPLYFGYSPQNNINTKSGNLDRSRARMSYVKSSAIPLYPGLTKSHEIDKLRKNIEKLDYKINKEQLDKPLPPEGETDRRNFYSVRAALGTAVKVGGDNKQLKLHEDVGKEQPDLLSKDLSLDDATILDRKNFGIQQEESVKHNYETVLVTQMNKLLTSTLIDTLQGEKPYEFKLRYDNDRKKAMEVRQEKEKIRKRMIELSEKALHEKLDYKDGKFNDIEKLKDLMIEKMSGTVTLNDLRYLDLTTNAAGEQVFKYPVGMSPIFNKAISALQAIIYKDVIRQKMPGGMMAQGASLGIKKPKQMSYSDFDNKSDIVYTSDFLYSKEREPRFFEKGKDDENYKPIQVVASWIFTHNGERLSMKDFIKEDKNGNTVLDDTKISKDMLQSIGARIPNQGQSSMTPIEIIGFLPQEYDDLILLPGEITRQTGSDFDIDHMYNYMYNYDIVKDSDIGKTLEDQLEMLEEKERKKEVWYKGRKMNKEGRPDFDINVIRKTIAADKGVWWSEKDQQYYKGRKMVKVESDPESDNIDAVKNAYIDLHFDVLLNPRVMEKVTQPLDSDEGKTIANEIKSILKGKKERSFKPLSYLHKDEEFLANQGGKDGIAIMSSGSTLLAELEGLNIKIKEDNRIKVLIDGKEVTLSTLGIGYYKDPEGNQRSNFEANSVIQTEAVDNANNKRLELLGFHPILASALQGLLYSRADSPTKNSSVSLRFISLMFNNPVVKELIDRASNSMMENDYKDLEEVIEEMEKEIKKKGSGIIRPLSEEGGEGSVSLVDALKSEYGGSIGDRLSILDLIKKANEIGGHFRYVNMVRGVETSGFGRNLNSSLSKESIFRDYIMDNKRSPIENLKRLFYNEDNSPTELGYIFEKGIETNSKMWKSKINGQNFAMQGTASHTRVAEKINNLLGEDKKYLTEDDFNIIDRGFRSYLFNNVKNNLYDKPVEEEFNELVLNVDGPNGLMNRVNHHRDNYSEGKFFLDALEFVNNEYSNMYEAIGKEGDMITKFYSSNIYEVNFNVDKLTGIGRQKYMSSFIEMLMSDDKETYQLGKDLVKYNYLVGGNTNFKSYNEIIPSTYLDIIGFSDYLRSINLDQEENSYEIATQIIENNLDMVTTWNNVKSNKIEANKVTKQGIQTLIIKEGKIDDAPIYVKSGSELFKRQNKSNTYKKINSREVIRNIKRFNSDTKEDIETFKKREDTGETLNNDTPAVYKKYFRSDESGISDKASIIDFTSKLIEEGKVRSKLLSAAKSVSFLSSLIPDDVIFKIDNSSEGRGQYFNNIIRINPTKFSNKSKGKKKFEDEFLETSLHEILHAINYEVRKEVIKERKDRSGRFKKGSPVYQRVEDLETLIDAVKEAIKSSDKYSKGFAEFEKENSEDTGSLSIPYSDIQKFQPLQNFDEFIAGFKTNKEFLDMLGDLSVEIREILRNSKDESVKRIANYYRDLIKTEGEPTTQVALTMSKAISEFYLDYMQEEGYSEEVEQLREKHKKKKLRGNLIRGNIVQAVVDGKKLSLTILKSDGEDVTTLRIVEGKPEEVVIKEDDILSIIKNRGEIQVGNKKYITTINGEFLDSNNKVVDKVTDNMKKALKESGKSTIDRDIKKKPENIFAKEDFGVDYKGTKMNLEEAIQEASVSEYDGLIDEFLSNPKVLSNIYLNGLETMLNESSDLGRLSKSLIRKKFATNTKTPESMGAFKPLLDINYVINTNLTDKNGNKRLANTNKDGEIMINPVKSVKEFFDYFEGRNKSNTSKQKKEVLKKLADKGFDSKAVRSLLNNKRRINKFLIYHEQSHLDNNDREVYFDKGRDLLTDDKVDIEVRASHDALLKIYNESKEEAASEETTTTEETQTTQEVETGKNKPFSKSSDILREIGFTDNEVNKGKDLVEKC